MAGGPASDASAVGDGKSKVVGVSDYDRDGDLDIVSASSTLDDPGAYLLRNRGDGTFEDATADSGVAIHDRGNPCAVLWTDFDSDGDPDLWIWNDRGGKVLLRNDDGRLSDITGPSGAGSVNINNPMGIDGADIDHDGDLDYYISNIGNNPLLRNNGDGTFVDITGRAGTGGDFGWGLGFEDFDADGWEDIFVAQEDDRPHLVFHHLGTDPPTFERIEVPHPPIVDGSAAHNVAVAFADYDRDGRTDVLVATTDGSPVVVYRNETDLGSHRYLHVHLDPAAPAVSARIAIGIGDEIHFRDVSGGSSRASQNALGVRLGLGNRSGVEWAAALWPSGSQTAMTNLEGNQHLQLPAP